MSKRMIRLIAVIATLALAGWRLVATPAVSAHDGHKQRNAPASAKKLKNPLIMNDETVANGRALYNQHCATCHGEDGKAKTETALALKRKPTDLTAPAMRGLSDGEIWWVVTHGITKSKMPAYKAKATEQERWQMTVYVKHLMGQHATVAQADHAAHHSGVNQRGDQVMGFSHEKTTHHFRLHPDGGSIEVEANDTNDSASQQQIRTHLRHIARKFAVGDFAAPMLIHAQSPPGVATLKQLKSVLRYQFEETQKGARVRIATKNAKARAAVHEFLRFQIADHKTGDSGQIEP